MRRGPPGQKEPRPPRDFAYMAAVKSLPCCVCGKPGPSDAHHPICGRYSFRRAPDADAIPLCKRHHQNGPDAIHNGKEGWVARFGPDTRYIKRTRQALARRGVYPVS